VAKLLTYDCSGIVFDFYDTERVPEDSSDANYYLTPKKLALVEKWLIENNIDKITTLDQMSLLIERGWIASYA
jgi:hypothetical protein